MAVDHYLEGKRDFPPWLQKKAGVLRSILIGQTSHACDGDEMDGSGARGDIHHYVNLIHQSLRQQGQAAGNLTE